MKYLLEDDEHMDAVFKLQNGQEIRAHRSILTARTKYFKALFRSNTFAESKQCVVTVEPEFTEQHIRSILYFIYTNRIPRVTQSTTDHLLALFQLADQWLLSSLQKVLEQELIKHVCERTVALLYTASEDYNGATRLQNACVDYIRANLKHLTANPDFEAAIQRHSPALTLHILKRAAASNAIISTAQVLPHQRRASKRARHTSPVPDAEPSSGGGFVGSADHEDDEEHMDLYV